MGDLVEQARQEARATQSLGLVPVPYQPDQAISDLLAILDDRIESEGVQVGLSEGFLHRMWTLCNEAQVYGRDRAWLESNVGAGAQSKARMREATYLALIEYVEAGSD